MTTRRQLLQRFPAIILLAVSPALAQRRDRPARIAVLSEGIDPRIRAPSLWAQFHQRLSELGYVEGTSYVMEWRWDDTEPGRLPALAAELVALKPDVIMAATTPAAVAAKRATSLIPIVITGTGDPVKSGLAASLARPGGNLTGYTIVTPDIAGKWIELLREIAPNRRSLAYLADTVNPALILTLRELQARAQPLGVAVLALDGRNPGNVERAFDVMLRERIDGLIVSITVTVLQQRQQIVEAAAHHRIPAIYARREYVEAGGLLSYGPDLSKLYPKGADYVHRILQGAKPSELPIEQAATFKLVVNLKAAKALGLKIPQSILVRADEVIQ